MAVSLHKGIVGLEPDNPTLCAALVEAFVRTPDVVDTELNTIVIDNVMLWWDEIPLTGAPVIIGALFPTRAQAIHSALHER